MDKGRKRITVVRRMGLLLLACLVLFGGYVFAKYVIQGDEKVPAIAKAFYFESDLLAVSTGVIPQYTLQAGVDTISFQLRNNPDELRTSEVDIAYTVTLSKDGEKVDEETGTLKTDVKNETVIFEDLEGGTYTVTAEATAPYVQTLQGKFTIVPQDDSLTYSVRDGEGSPILKITVETTDYAGGVEIILPEGVKPDNTDPLLAEATGKICHVNVKANSEYVFQFFKTNSKEDYTDVITVTKVD